MQASLWGRSRVVKPERFPFGTCQCWNPGSPSPAFRPILGPFPPVHVPIRWVNSRLVQNDFLDLACRPLLGEADMTPTSLLAIAGATN